MWAVKAYGMLPTKAGVDSRATQLIGFPRKSMVSGNDSSYENGHPSRKEYVKRKENKNVNQNINHSCVANWWNKYEKNISTPSSRSLGPSICEWIIW